MSATGGIEMIKELSVGVNGVHEFEIMELYP